MRYAVLLCLVLIAPSFARAEDSPKLQLKDGDRIVYLGNTFVERDANYGYLETLLTVQNPDINFTFRNLGWSGDTVWGDARARFGTRADGFAHLKEHVLALKPTVILVGYGMNESFAGEAGLAEFESGLNVLLDTLSETTAKIVLISPLDHEKLPPPLPDPAKHNADIALYRETMAKVARSRGAEFVDGSVLSRLLVPGNLVLTDDGIHPVPLGYAFIAEALAQALGYQVDPERLLALTPELNVSDARGWKVENVRATDRGVTFEATADHLPDGLAIDDLREASLGWWGFTHSGLSKGEHVVKIDGKAVRVVPSFPPREQFLGVASGPETDQVDKLRDLINKKNELYFHRWRPQNETYLFGFRKHEQGNNAVEIPQFDPLIEELEAQINTLKKPVKHVYEIVREEAVK